MDASEVLRSEAAREFRAPNGVTEDNWKSRMHFCNTMADAIITYGRGSDRYPKDFAVQIEPYLNNVLECAVSERTQLSNSACKLLGNLPKVLEKDMLHHLDRILPVLLKLCANTKAVTVKIAAIAVSNVVSESGYSPRLLFWVCSVFEEKAVKPKENATGWIQTILSQYAKYLNYKDFELLGHAIRLGLEDADAAVRTNVRAAYWSYYKVDTEGAEAIVDKLNPQAKKALQNDPHNPDKKSATSAAKQPERPKSALAQIKKDKLKRVQEAQSKNKALSTSTASQDSIEVHEPRNPRMDKPKRAERPQVTAPAPAPVEEAESKQSRHKKMPSQEDSSKSEAAKGNNRLFISAPVRRPRINVMPMNAPQNARPSSRTGYTHPTRELVKEPVKEARPTSSSSSKSIATPAPHQIPKPVMSPGHKGATPRGRAAYVSDGKENDANAAKPNTRSKTSPPVDMPEPKPQPLPPSPIRRTRRVEVKPGMQVIQTPVEANMHPDDYIHIKGIELQRDMAKHPFSRMMNPVDPEEYNTGKDAARTMAKLGPSVTSGPVDLATGQRYLASILPKIVNVNSVTGVAEDIDPLGYRKLKNIVLQYPNELITNQETFDMLILALLKQLWCKDEIQYSKRTDLSPTTNPVYSRQVILQITVSLLSGYPAWSFGWHPFWLCCMIVYRLTFATLERESHGAQYVHKNIDTVIYNFPNPLDLIDSVYAAIEEGERAITKNPDFALHKERPADPPVLLGAAAGSLDSEVLFPFTPPLPSIDENKWSYDPYTVHGKWMEVARQKGVQPGAFEHYLARAINEQNIYDTEHDFDPKYMPKQACLLWETALQCLTLILQQATQMNETIDSNKADMLGHIATHCLKSYDAQIKRSVIPFVKALYMIMKDDERFFSYFLEESERNLLEYYLVTVRGVGA